MSAMSRTDDSEQEFVDGGTPRKMGVGMKWSPMRSDDESSGDEDDDNIEVSLDEIKQKTLGRKINSMYDPDSPAAAANNNDNDESKMIMDVNAFSDGKTAANHLRQDLTCTVCHELLHNPVTLVCGHSFCEVCLGWWMKELGIQIDVNDSEEEYDEANTGTCPTCRRTLPPREKGKPLFCVNTALKACLNTLYGMEMNQRRKADVERKLKAIRGEKGGLHERGNEEIVKLNEESEADVRDRNEIKDEENGWEHIYSARSHHNNTPSKKISVRRNVVIDDCDQRYQLSIGMTKCIYSRTTSSRTLDAELCLVAMEEDEVECGGFPIIIVEGSDDEALICTSNDRVHSCIQSSTILISTAPFGGVENQNDALREVILTRGMIGQDGNVRFRIDVDKVLSKINSDDSPREMELVKLKFVHMDTNLVLEIRLPVDGSDDIAECNIDFGVDECNTKNDATRFLLDDRDDDEEEEMPDDYEDDGFIVNESDVESSGGAESDNDECEICQNGGELLVCDGGDHGGGCGKSYHIKCINRESVPEGAYACVSIFYL